MKHTNTTSDIFDSILYKTYAELTKEERDEFHTHFGDDDYESVQTTIRESQSWFKESFDALDVPVDAPEVYKQRIVKEERQRLGISPVLVAIDRFLHFRVPVYQMLMVAVLVFTGFIALRDGGPGTASFGSGLMADSVTHQNTLISDSNAASKQQPREFLSPAAPVHQEQMADSSGKSEGDLEISADHHQENADPHNDLLAEQTNRFEPLYEATFPDLTMRSATTYLMESDPMARFQG